MIRLAAPAKLNLSLEVLGHREDGYHALETIFQSVDMHDTVSVALEPGTGISLTCTDPGLPTGADNLAWRAAHLYVQRRPLTGRVHILLDKRIPSGAGLGGGSSDAAAVLRACQRLPGTPPLAPADLAEVALHLGSDVPFFLMGGTAHAVGRGEVLTPLQDLPRIAVTIFKPPHDLATPTVYKEMTEAERGPRQARGAAWWREFLTHHQAPPPDNRLTAAAARLEPQVRTLLAWLREQGVPHLLSGSGSACFALTHLDGPPGVRVWRTWFRSRGRLDALDAAGF